MSGQVSLDQMIRQIREWHNEALNMRNDGWTQQAYKDRLNFLHARTTAIIESISPAEYRSPGEEDNNEES
jgi:hypothetical protein